MTCTVAIVVLDETLASAVCGALDMLNTANIISRTLWPARSPAFQWQVLSETGEPVTASNGCMLAVDGSWSDPAGVDVAYLPGIALIEEDRLLERLSGNGSLLEWLRTLAAHNSLITASCSGSFFLAEAGLLDGQAATTAWPLTQFFEHRYPRVDLKSDALLADAGRTICAGSAMSYQDLMIAVIRRHQGRALAKLTARYMNVDGNRGSQAAYRIQTHGLIRDPLIRTATKLIRRGYHKTLSIEGLADALKVSSRTLVRRFRDATGEGPNAYIQKQRIESAKQLLETTPMSLNEILSRVGYSDNSSFRRLFKRRTGLTPGDYRRRFGLPDSNQGR